MADNPSLLRSEASSLRAFLGDFSAEATQEAASVKIEDYVATGTAIPLRLQAVAREANGKSGFTVFLVRSSEGWSGRCTCTAGYRCRHVHALGSRRLVQLAGAADAARATQPSPSPASLKTTPETTSASAPATATIPPPPPAAAEPPSLAVIIGELMGYLKTFDAGSRSRGLDIARGRAVKILGATKGILGAQVSGSADEPYVTTLGHGARGWYGECSCPVGYRCKHLYAVGIKAIETAPQILREIVAASPRLLAADSDSGAASAPKSHSVPPAGKPGKAPTFREIWEPQLSKKIGRALTRDEGTLLGKLAAAFNELKNRGGLYKSWLHQNGLSPTPGHSPVPYSYECAFEGYWTRETFPADPWALWQFIAYDWQSAGRALPEAFLPMTDTSRVREFIDQLTLKRELEAWRFGLRPDDTQRFAQSRPGAEELAKTADVRLQIDALANVDIHGLYTTPKSNRLSWRAVPAKWVKALDQSGPEDWAHFPEPARRLALALRLRPGPVYGAHNQIETRLSAELIEHLVAKQELHACFVLPGETPFRIEPGSLQLIARTIADDPARLAVSLALPDGTPLSLKPPRLLSGKASLYLWENRLWPGPPPPVAPRLPVAALTDPLLVERLRETGLRLPSSLEARFQTVSLPPFLRLWTQDDSYQTGTTLRAKLHARSDSPPCAQEWTGFEGWRWLPPGPPSAAGPDAPHFAFERAKANAVGARFGDFRFNWWDGDCCWARPIGKNFPEEFIAWRATLPADLEIEVSPELRGLLGDSLRAKLSVNLAPAEGSGQDWFDLSLQLAPEDTTLTPEELQLLVKARGAWVRLPTRGWQRLALADALTPEAEAALHRLGLNADEEALSGRRVTHRYHALQLADAPVDDAALAARLRSRAAELRALPPPALPAGLSAELRPYQLDGYHFLAYLSAQGLGGVLADDMGLGKTLQTLAWLLWLSEEISNSKSQISNGGKAAFRALVVAPKSVVPNWSVEAGRFAPALVTARLAPGLPPSPEARIVVVNYTQLRLRAADLAAVAWDAVVLDEGQNIKNPASATARAARDLPATHRLVLSGTPIENRLLDLWSLLAFAQPGLLGSQAGFQRLYNDKEDPAGSRARLAARVRPFLLRRTKGQVARDLPPRIEEEISCELDGVQRALYDAELKRARQLLMKVGDARQFDAQRFNILQSLLRLRQICCDPRLLGLDVAEAAAPAKPAAAKKKSGRPAKVAKPPVAAENDQDGASARPPSAKLEALLDTIEPLVAEGHRVLVFSQFVTMLDLIRDELIAREIRYLQLTGQTENRQELVNQFQAPDGPPVFLLSLKAAGSGLNLTAASYVVLFDPWWNPAVEAQAIDRVHRIGQANTVIAYRLVAKDTIEEKIRALQREKADLAAAVVQEESLAKVMDLESLRRILA